MNRQERLRMAFDLQQPDRPPILGGWLAAPEHIQAITGCSHQEYWADPEGWGLEAERRLGSDGVITIFVPIHEGEYRCVDEQVLAHRSAYTMESALAEIDGLPEPEAMAAAFDEEAAYAAFIAEHQARQRACGDLLWTPADWQLIPKALWYHEYGYETALMALALEPARYGRAIRFSAERGRQHAILRARAIREGLHPRAILTGEDLCGQQGPLVSPAFLREGYWPLVEYALEPLLDVGAKIVWHCDGNYRPLLDDVLACGVGGLQGFQRECGMELEWIRTLRTRAGDPLLIFGPLSVTTTLPHGAPGDVRAAVAEAMDLCRDQASLVFFTSNTITPDVPLENILTFWDAVQTSHW